MYSLSTSILVHPCDKKGKGGCSHKCLKNEEEEEEGGEGYTCACPPGFELEEDGKTCEKGNWIQDLSTKANGKLRTMVGSNCSSNFV